VRCHAVVIASAHGQVAWIFRRRRIKRFHLRYSAATPHGQGQISCILPPTLSDRLRANGYAHVRGHEPSEHRQAGGNWLKHEHLRLDVEGAATRG
jgi:hypothetical protein